MKNSVSRCFTSTLCIFACSSIVISSDALAVRPFITDDARVTPEHTFLTEASVRYDQNLFQNLVLFAFGITNRIELTVGFINGCIHNQTSFPENYDRQYSIYGPLLQIKYLIADQTTYLPAIGCAVGLTPPWGAGSSAFIPEQWNEFGFLCVSRSFSSNPENLNVHLNIGSMIDHDRTEKHPLS